MSAVAAAGGSAVANALDPNKVSPGLLGFIIVVIIGIAVWFLARSMAKQLRKLDADRVEEAEQGEADGAEVKDAAGNNPVGKNAAVNNTAVDSTAPKDTASNGAH